MVKAVRRGMSIRKAAAAFGVAKSTVQAWVKKTTGKRLDRVQWSDKPSGARVAVNRVDPGVETCVITIRKRLHESSDLGEFGADAIRREMKICGCWQLPGRATIHRILERNGQLDGRQRVRCEPPPPGWYLPEDGRETAELDSFDYVEDLHIHGGDVFHVLNGISLRGSLVGSWPMTRMSLENTVRSLLLHWRGFGLPDYVQFERQGAAAHACFRTNEVVCVALLTLAFL